MTLTGRISSRLWLKRARKPAGKCMPIADAQPLPLGHWVLETPNANLVAGMAWLQSTYTIRLNHRHKLAGHVLSGRYKPQLVEVAGTVTCARPVITCT
jgi:hypothetical protein